MHSIMIKARFRVLRNNAATISLIPTFANLTPGFCSMNFRASRACAPGAGSAFPMVWVEICVCKIGFSTCIFGGPVRIGGVKYN